MPELPEVETTRQGLLPHVADQTFSGARVRNAALRYPVDTGLDRILRGRRLLALRRRAKYLLFECEDGTLLVHLGMSGSLRVVPTATPPQVHDHVDLLLGELALRLRDPRRFGAVLWIAGGADRHPLLAHLGPEPLEAGFDGPYLTACARGRRTAIKTLIMDSRVVVGVGNIYAAESLFRARIHPGRPAGRIGSERLHALAAAIKATLTEALAAGGSTLRDFVGSDGKPGYFQQRYDVYGREGQPCRVCGTEIRREVIGQRSSCYCPKCQR